MYQESFHAHSEIPATPWALVRHHADPATVEFLDTHTAQNPAARSSANLNVLPQPHRGKKRVETISFNTAAAVEIIKFRLDSGTFFHVLAEASRVLYAYEGAKRS